MHRMLSEAKAEQRSDPRHAHQGRVRTHVASDGALGVFGFFCFFGGVELGDVPGLADSGDSYDMGESYSRGMCCFLFSFLKQIQGGVGSFLGVGGVSQRFVWFGRAQRFLKRRRAGEQAEC